jgi:hypothetical protein
VNAISAGPLENAADGGLTSEGGNQTVTLSISVVSGGSNLVGTPTLAQDGTLTFQLAENANGAVVLRVRAQDNGPTGNGHVNFSEQDVTLNITPVNDAPNANDDLFERVFKNQTNPSAPFNVLANDNAGPANESGQTIRIIGTPTIVSPSPAPAGLSVSAVDTNADGRNDSLVLTNTQGFVGTIEVEYTIEDSGTPALTDTATATFEIVDFLPGTISGFVFADVNDNGHMDPVDPPLGPERGIAGVEVYLSGTSAFGDPDLDLGTPGVQTVVMVRTNEHGQYTFSNIVPGTFTISLDNPDTHSAVEIPELFIDRVETAADNHAIVDDDFTATTSLSWTGNNRYEVEFDENGTAVTELNFGMLGLQSPYVSIRDGVSSATRNGFVVGLNKAQTPAEQQYWYSLYDGWQGASDVSVSVAANLSTAVISWRSNNLTHTVTLNIIDNPATTQDDNDWRHIRVMGYQGDQVVLRIVGTLSELSAHPTHTTTPTGGNSEGEYSSSVDEVFAGW